MGLYPGNKSEQFTTNNPFIYILPDFVTFFSDFLAGLVYINLASC